MLDLIILGLVVIPKLVQFLMEIKVKVMEEMVELILHLQNLEVMVK